MAARVKLGLRKLEDGHQLSSIHESYAARPLFWSPHSGTTMPRFIPCLEAPHMAIPLDPHSIYIYIYISIANHHCRCIKTYSKCWFIMLYWNYFLVNLTSINHYTMNGWTVTVARSYLARQSTCKVPRQVQRLNGKFRGFFGTKIRFP